MKEVCTSKVAALIATAYLSSEGVARRPRMARRFFGMGAAPAASAARRVRMPQNTQLNKYHQ